MDFPFESNRNQLNMEQDAEKEAREAQVFLDGLPPSPPPETTAGTDAPSAPPLPPQQVLRRPPKLPSDYFASRPKQAFMAAKFAAAEKASAGSTRATTLQPMFTPCHMFFYGSLMDPQVLKTVTRASTMPVLRQGSIKGFRIRMWGIYPTLVSEDENDGNGSRITGMVWKVEDVTQFLFLQQYETERYRACPCTIETENGEVLDDGMVFCWSGDSRSGELEDGTFDLERYQKYFKSSVVR
ncbi:hypothetical protein HD806DRAFT_492229 [Xylariaceae sp. AK1471]|nr:hypothetical protein HD806DRAFT_492229 [Xylariaceae sp. AK1471]